MSSRPWEFAIAQTKILTICPTTAVTGAWRAAFDKAIGDFNQLARDKAIGVRFQVVTTLPAPDGDGGANVQFDLGDGLLPYTFNNTPLFVMDDDTPPQPLKFNGSELHGVTQRVGRGSGNRKAFIWVPKTPMVHGPIDPVTSRQPLRLTGIGLMSVIAMHEMIHACGLFNSSHTQPDSHGDTFVTLASVTADKDPSKDVLAFSSNPAIKLPPNRLSKSTVDELKKNWP